MQSIRRLYVAKKGVFADEAKRLLTDLQENLLIKGLTDIHIYHRYDVSGLDDAAFEAAKNMIFSEPPVDAVYDELPAARTTRSWPSNICRASTISAPIRPCSACRC